MIQSASAAEIYCAAIRSSSLLPVSEYVPGKSTTSMRFPPKVTVPVAIPTVFSLFYQPYWTALCTSLYFDGIARDKEAADKKAAAPLQSAPAAEVTTEDDLNKSAAADQPTPAVLWRAAPEGARLWAAADLCTPAEPVIPAETVDPDETSIVKE